MNKLKFYLAGIFCLATMFGLGHLASANSTITGTALKTDGTPIESFTMLLFNDTEVYSDSTDADGDFSITVDTAPISGNYTLKPQYDYDTVFDLGFILTHVEYFYPQSLPVAVTDGVNQNVSLPSFNQHGAVSGQIKDNSGTPISGASLTVWNKNGQSFSGTGSSNALGNYYVTPLYYPDYLVPVVGTYQAYITKVGFLPKYVPDFSMVDNSVNQIDPTETTLTRKSYISGNIKSKNGTNLSNIVVKIYRLGDSAAYAVTQTDTNGNYSIELGRTGSSYLFGDFTAKGKYILEIAGDDTAAYNKKTKNISVKADESSLSKNFTLSKKNGKLSGKVKTKKGKKIEGATVKVNLISDPRITSTTYTNSKGKYVFSHLTSGTYQITVSKDGYVNYESANLKVKKGSHKNINLATAGDISGYVFDKFTKKPVVNASIFLFNSDIYAVSNSSGYYVMKNVPTGNKKIFFRNPYYVEQFYNNATSPDRAKNINVKKNKENKNNNFYITEYTRVNR